MGPSEQVVASIAKAGLPWWMATMEHFMTWFLEKNLKLNKFISVDHLFSPAFYWYVRSRRRRGPSPRVQPQLVVCRHGRALHATVDQGEEQDGGQGQEHRSSFAKYWNSVSFSGACSSPTTTRTAVGTKGGNVAHIFLA